MTRGQDPDADDRAQRPSGDEGRAWQHPSEVGLATRGRIDRKRTALIASGVVLSGLGLLVAGVLMGSFDDPPGSSDHGTPLLRAEQSIASITAVDADGAASMSTGLVIDDRGHLLVDARSLDGAEEIWAKCTSGDMEQVALVGTDATSSLAVLRLPTPAGVPASVSSSPPGEGSALDLVEVNTSSVRTTGSVAGPLRDGSARFINLGTRGPLQHFAAQVESTGPDDALAGAMVFDRAGRLAGIATDASAAGPGGAPATMQVLVAEDAMEVAEDLIRAAG